MILLPKSDVVYTFVVINKITNDLLKVVQSQVLRYFDIFKVSAVRTEACESLVKR